MDQENIQCRNKANMCLEIIQLVRKRQ